MKSMPSPQALILSAVGVVVFLVSVPRVHQFALQDNERDAISSLLALSGAVHASEGEPRCESLPLQSTWDREMSRRLCDAHQEEKSSLIQRHGYLLELAHHVDGTPFIRAWPSEHGATGRTAYLLDKEQGLIKHANTGGSWSGTESMRPDGTEPGWSPKSLGS